MNCHKLQFRTMRMAKRHAKAMRKDLGKACQPLHAYRCDQCAAWHLTRREAWVTENGIQIYPKI